MAALRRIAKVVAKIRPQVLHGHGAKGGLYARLAAGRVGAKAFYTPHGGVLHYQWSSPAGALFLMTERMLLNRTDGLVFVCDFERKAFEEKIGLGGRTRAVVHNGLWPEDFSPVRPSPEVTDLLFIGELRHLKGVDVLIAAIAEAVMRKRRSITATIVGDGPDRQAFEQAAEEAGLASSVCFTGAMPARDAFALGRAMVIPSRAESFPYIVLEAIAAGLPIIASSVGGIPEALDASCLVPPGDAAALAEAIARLLDNPALAHNAAERRLEEARIRFDAEEMGTKITRFYRKCGA